MSNLTDFISGSGGLDPRKMTKVEITTSQDWVAPKAKYNKFFVLVQGAGGGGTAACNGNGNYYASAIGGLAGGYKVAIMTLTEDSTITATIGAGGAGGSLTGQGVSIGSTGGDTSFGNIVAKGGACTNGYQNGGPLSYTFESPLSGIVRFYSTGYYDSSYYHISQVCSSRSVQENFYGLESFHSNGFRDGIFINDISNNDNVEYAKQVTGGEDSIIGLGGAYGDAQTGGDGVDGAGGGGAVHNNDSAINAGSGGDGKVIIYYEAV